MIILLLLARLLKGIDAPHGELHRSAEKIRHSLEQGRVSEAREVFNTVSMPAAENTIGVLDKMIAFVALICFLDPAS